MLDAKAGTLFSVVTLNDTTEEFLTKIVEQDHLKRILPFIFNPQNDATIPFGSVIHLIETVSKRRATCRRNHENDW